MSELQERAWEQSQQLEVLPVGPRARVCPTAKPGSHEEKIQVNHFWDRVYINAQNTQDLARSTFKLPIVEKVKEGPCDPELQNRHSSGQHIELREAALPGFCLDVMGNESVPENTGSLQSHSDQGDASQTYESERTHYVDDTFEVQISGIKDVYPDPEKDEQHNSSNKAHHSSTTSLSTPLQGSAQHKLCQGMKDITLKALDMNNREQRNALADVQQTLLDITEIAVLGAFTSAPSAPSDLTDIRMAVMRGDFAPELLKIAESAQAVSL